MNPGFQPSIAPLPQARERRGDHPFTEGNDLVVIVKDHAEGEAVTAGFGKAAHAGKISAGDGRRRLYLDADDPTAPIFGDQLKSD